VDLRDPQEQRRWIGVIAAAAVAATLLGFFGATRRAPTPAGYRVPPSSEHEQHAPAPTHAQLARGRQSKNRGRQPAALAALASQAAPPAELAHDESAWRAQAQARAARRAYEGAPPVIPHPIEQRGMPSCASCHERTLRIADATAPSPSHEPHANCAQCHVVAQAPMPLMAAAAPLLPDNSFRGLESAGKGARAWPGAPPEIPHATFMRERCASCHGALSAGLHSSHPARQSCTQCHGLSAELDQRPGLIAPAAIAVTP
jgi:nitrate reductase (cytochrome), electron transfer subunit